MTTTTQAPVNCGYSNNEMYARIQSGFGTETPIKEIIFILMGRRRLLKNYESNELTAIEQGLSTRQSNVSQKIKDIEALIHKFDSFDCK